MGSYTCPNDYPDGCTCRDSYCKSRRKSKRGSGSQVTGAVLAAGMGALTLGQAYNEPTQTSVNTFGNYADAKAENTGANRARGQRRETTYKGRQSGGSSGKR